MREDRLRIGEVARGAGVNIQTLRYYERRGLLEAPNRTASGYRKYPSETVRLIRFIKRAQDLGFTLNEIEELIALRDASGRKRRDVRALAEAKVGDIERKLAQLQAMKSALEVLVERCAWASAVCPCTLPVGLGVASVAGASEADGRRRALEVAAAFFGGIVLNLTILGALTGRLGALATESFGRSWAFAMAVFSLLAAVYTPVVLLTRRRAAARCS